MGVSVADRAGSIDDRAPEPPHPGAPGTGIMVGLVGHGIGQSRTPRMHEVEGARLGLRYIYRLFDTAAAGTAAPPLADIIAAAELCGFAGLNITHPYKQAALAHLDELSDAARRSNAVNTIVFRGGRRHGHNTDLWGFAESFRRGLPGAPRGRVLLLGAGGAGGAVAQALLDEGVERLLVLDTDGERAAALAAQLAERFGAGRAEAVTEPFAAGLPDGIVNATPVGMATAPGCPVPPSGLSDRTWVADLVYFPLETDLLRAARACGCRTLAGSGMAVFQAVRAFELFTGLRPDSERMEATFEAFPS